MFQTDLLSIIRSLNTVFTVIGICHASYVDCLLARSGGGGSSSCHHHLTSTVTITSIRNTHCYVYSVETPDDGQQICLKHAEFLRNSVSQFLLQEYITIHSPLNVKINLLLCMLRKHICERQVTCSSAQSYSQH